MVGDTCRADARGLGTPHQEPDSVLRTETGVEAHGAGVRGAIPGSTLAKQSIFEHGGLHPDLPRMTHRTCLF